MFTEWNKRPAIVTLYYLICYVMAYYMRRLKSCEINFLYCMLYMHITCTSAFEKTVLLMCFQCA